MACSSSSSRESSGSASRRDERHGNRLAGRPLVLARQPERVGDAQRLRQHTGLEPFGVEPFRVDGKPWREIEAPRSGGVAQTVAVGPGCFRVDVVDRHGRDPAPVVDPGVEQPAEVLGQVRRSLQVDLGLEQHACGGDRPEVILDVRLGRGRHLGAGLGAEVLDDHLLDVTVPLVRVADRNERVEPLGPCLADPDQDPGCERHALLPGGRKRGEPRRGVLVGRAEMWPASRGEAFRGRLEHQAHRRRHGAQRADVVGGEDAGVEVRQQTGLLKHGSRSAREVLEGRRAAELRKLLPSRPVAQLRLVAEREQRFPATGRSARPRDLQHLVDRHVRPLAAPRRRSERAVVADVAAELRQRHEHLRRIGDEPAAPIANAARRAQQVPAGAPRISATSTAQAYVPSAQRRTPSDFKPRRTSDRRSELLVVAPAGGELADLSFDQQTGVETVELDHSLSEHAHLVWVELAE